VLTEPLFYLVSVPAVMLYGIAKGGFAGPAAILAVPLMSLVMSPVLAAGILLPILVLMDALVVRTYWGRFDRTALIILLPAAMIGILLGYLAADVMSDDHMRILIGALAMAFGLQNLLQLNSTASREHNRVTGSVFGMVSGFTSFSIHAGGPPLAMYLLPRRLDPLIYAGTAGLFFAAVNFVKLVPYYSLGQLGMDNLALSLVLMPLAPLGVKIGHWLALRSEPGFYYRVISFFLVIVGARLLWAALAVPSV
jgi:uncharacterized membrane protein YfcA